MKKKTRFIALIMALAMILPLTQSAFAAEKTDGNDTVSVTFSSSDTDIIMPEQTVTAYDGIAEEYGYTVATQDHNGKAVDETAFFDVLVASHKLYYGSDFTAETAGNYLVMNNGFITKAFGKSAYASGFTVDGVVPNDGIINATYGSYTGYTCDTAEIDDGSFITFYFYQDKSYWSDFSVHFDKNEYTVKPGESLPVNIGGYCVMYYGINDIDVINQKYTLPVTGGEIYTYADGVSTKIGETDAEGKASLTFDSEGTYKVYVKGTTTDSSDEECPVIISWCTVNVVSDAQPQKTILQKILSVLKVIISYPVKLFKYIISLF